MWRKASFLFLGIVDAGVKADSPYPGTDELISLIFLESFPEVDKYLLKQIIHLICILGENIADRVDPPFVLTNDLRKFSFLVVHN